MFDIYLAAFGYEHCVTDKPAVKQIYTNFSIHYILSGHGYYNGIRLGTGEGFVGIKNLLQEYRPDPEDPWVYMFFRIEGKDVLEALNHCGISTPPYTFKFSFSNRLSDLCSIITENLPDFSPGYRPSILPRCMKTEALAKLLLSYHESPKTERSEKKRSLKSVHVERIEHYILQNYHRKLTIDEIAAELHLSRGYMRNIFFESKGISPRDYLITLRINRAKELLSANHPSWKNLTVNISTVASSVGYDDVLQFSKLFKKHTGFSPSEYKAQNK